jgi:resuscitation-promoting factor RpfB
MWSRLKPMQRVGIILAALLLPCCGGSALIAAFADDPKPAQESSQAADQRIAEIVPTTETRTTPAESAGQEDDPAPSAEEAAEPVVEKRTETKRKAVPYKTRKVKDSSLDEGETSVRTRGVAGVRTLTYEVTITDGEVTSRKLVRSVVTKKAVTKVVVVGTRSEPAGSCHPDYSPCVPIASDVDCAGGSGNGPAYVSGPVRIIGGDPYDLDRDGDGVACDT